MEDSKDKNGKGPLLTSAGIVVVEWQKWCVENQCDINPFCTSATRKLAEMIREAMLVERVKYLEYLMERNKNL